MIIRPAPPPAPVAIVAIDLPGRIEAMRTAEVRARRQGIVLRRPADGTSRCGGRQAMTAHDR